MLQRLRRADVPTCALVRALRVKEQELARLVREPGVWGALVHRLRRALAVVQDDEDGRRLLEVAGDVGVKQRIRGVVAEVVDLGELGRDRTRQGKEGRQGELHLGDVEYTFSYTLSTVRSSESNIPTMRREAWPFLYPPKTHG